MNVTRLYGGLGNQMFQYAIARAYELRTGIPFIIDTLHLTHAGTPRRYELGHFACNPKARNHWDRLRRTVKVDERITTPERVNALTLDNLEFVGYWQNERYFKDYAEQIRKDFTLKGSRKGFVIPDSVAVHLRLGDYVGNSLHPVQPVDYYQRAFDIIESEVMNPRFYLFSDGPIPAEYIQMMRDRDCNISLMPPNDGPYDLDLMKNYEHNIIANSSFSWWGAWLNENPDKIVIAPRHWFNGQEFGGYCPGWRVI
jgi:hypothetical protein